MESNGGQDIKNTIRKTYNKIALQQDNIGDSFSYSCCAPGCCSGGEGTTNSPAQAAVVVGYEASELESVPEASILGVGCGAPVNFSDLRKGETDLLGCEKLPGLNNHSPK